MEPTLVGEKSYKRMMNRNWQYLYGDDICSFQEREPIINLIVEKLDQIKDPCFSLSKQ